jgi:hypothetical protein
MEHISADQVRASSSRSQHVWEELTANFQKNKKNIPAVMTKHSARLAGFEPARGDPNRFQVCHLNHSVTVALQRVTSISNYIAFKTNSCPVIIKLDST